ncbi:MAG: glycine--tRNA ligase subunit beta [Synechococcaceae cyanobacterium]|nr:glycine--tRNA ligase subunit beta [Synechococcaceae cyanobacterium]
MATFLLEIGTEELPADFARQALSQLGERVANDLAADRLGHGTLRTLGTPRRLAVLIADLQPRQQDLVQEHKGPPAAQAFAAGQPTAAALGFAKRCGVAPEALEVRDTERGPFVFAQSRSSGATADQLLEQRIPGWIWSLQGRRFMRWGAGESRFSRPLRWLVALLDDAVVPVHLEDCDPPLASDRLSWGHRLLEQPIAIAHAEAYISTLAAADVQVDRDARAAAIAASIAAAAAATGANPELPTSLFEELVDLVEAPRLIEGGIEDRFLDLPPEVLTTVMRLHQRYVPLLRQGVAQDPLALEARGCLLPRFLCVSNGRPQASDTIRQGNERVLRARLADAEFFVRADRAIASIDRREQLARVTFAEGLGSLQDRSDRLAWWTDVLLEQLALTPDEAEHARRAAHLCKHDLVSQMVGEFPELQGVMGGKYLLAEGEPRAVALAVLEHYLPRGAGDALPSTNPGAVVALAERLELLLTIWAAGQRPSGSSDPYALRRAGNGVLLILWERNWSLDLGAILRRGTARSARLFEAFPVDAGEQADEIGEFFRQRLASLLEDGGTPQDLVQAVAGPGVDRLRLLADPADARRRAALLSDLRDQGVLDSVRAVVQRATRLAAKGDLPPTQLSTAAVVDPALFSSSSEADMLTVLNQLEPLAQAAPPGRYEELALGLSGSAATLAAFFDGPHSVLVMADDSAVRRNRLNLLGVLRNQAAVLADFDQIKG